MQATKLLEQKLARYQAFYRHPEPGQLLITIPPYTFQAPPAPGSIHQPLSAWHPFEDAERMAENAVLSERFFMDYTRDVDSDYIPAVNPSYGIGLNSAFLTNAEVIPGIDTSWIHPVLHEWDDLNGLCFDEANPWMDFMRRFMRRAMALNEGDYCVIPLSAMAPSDLANALRGNELFYDLYDEPEQVNRLLTLCTDATLQLYQNLHPLGWTPDEGFTAGGLWMPGGGIFLSEDAADLCSPAVYREHFFRHTQRLIDGIGGAYIHHHALGWKVQAEIAKLANLRFLEFSWDPNCPRPVDHLEEVLAMTGSVPLQIRCTLPDLKKYIEVLKQGRVAMMVNVDTLEEAKEAVRLVRKHSKI